MLQLYFRIQVLMCFFQYSIQLKVAFNVYTSSSDHNVSRATKFDNVLFKQCSGLIVLLQ